MRSPPETPPTRSGPVRVALLQQSGLGPDPERNLARLVAEIDAVGETGVDLVVATELATTAYFGACTRDFREWAESIPGRATAQVGDRARRHRTTIVLPLYAREGDRGLDVAVVLGPDGAPIPGRSPDGRSVPYYVKVHLPEVAVDDLRLDEPRHFRAGDALPVFDTPAGRLGILICYDRRFPEAWRTLALGGAEIVAVPSCVPAWTPAAEASTGDMFVTELRTRACENLLHVLACNRAGVERLDGKEAWFVGRSCVIGPGGALKALASADHAETLRAEIDLAEVAAARRRLPLFRDRRPDVYSSAVNTDVAASAATPRRA